MKSTHLYGSGPAARQQGAALLLAMLVVTLVATFAATALWQQWRSVEVESAQRTRTRMAWVLTGTLDWARLILLEDARTSQIDHLSEPWALPLQEARLGSFLAVDQNHTEDTDEAFLSGQISDQQALLNVNNLVDNGKRALPDVAMWTRLFARLALPQAQLNTLIDNLVLASQQDGKPGRPLHPTRVAQLGWLGLPPATIAALSPYVTLLPTRTTVNLNTASATVLYAALPGLDAAQAQRMVAQRSAQHFIDLQQALSASGLRAKQIDTSGLGVSSNYFAVRGRLRMDQTTVQEVSLVERQGTAVKVLWRQREPLARDAAAMAASLQ